ncbi:uncharacterized protein LOC142639945 [Castanea sativa]|uniref:uncharacterized protein LOC142639945 n=1 Tax=Castanea sativa TaxID=21020 RepID=UPI003F64C489
MWLRDPKCHDVVSKAWERGLMSSSGCPLSNCLQACREDLTDWYKKEFGHVGRRIAQLQKKLQFMEASGAATSEEIQSAKADLNVWLDAEETMRKQRSRNMWLKLGDKITSFFHTKASNKKARNYIMGLTDLNGVWQEDPSVIEDSY